MLSSCYTLISFLFSCTRCLRKEEVRIKGKLYNMMINSYSKPSPIHSVEIVWRRYMYVKTAQQVFSSRLPPGGIWKCIKRFPFTLPLRNFKTRQSAAILDSCLKKTRSGKSRDYCDATVCEKVRFSKSFAFTPKRQGGVYKSLRFEERLPKRSVFVPDKCGRRARFK